MSALFLMMLLLHCRKTATTRWGYFSLWIMVNPENQIICLSFVGFNYQIWRSVFVSSWSVILMGYLSPTIFCNLWTLIPRLSLVLIYPWSFPAFPVVSFYFELAIQVFSESMSRTTLFPPFFFFLYLSFAPSLSFFVLVTSFFQVFFLNCLLIFIPCHILFT